MLKRFALVATTLLSGFLLASAAAFAAAPEGSAHPVIIVTGERKSPKLDFATNLLAEALRSINKASAVQSAPTAKSKGYLLRLEVNPEGLPEGVRKAEGFTIDSDRSGSRLNGFDDAGLLYAAQEFAQRIRKTKEFPVEMRMADVPKMSMRGVVMFLMTAGSYDYPITATTFPWFYDQKLWIKTLDSLSENRINFISIWNSHPFPYFVRLPKYPEVKVATAEELDRNVQLMDWLSKEAEKRNIWLMFQFYNIHVPGSFAEAHGFPKDPSFNGYVLSEPNPVVAEYTRYAISQFVGKFPSVGLYVCLGEALQKDQSYWMDDVILAGVKDSGKHPPVILRNWALGNEGLRILKEAKAHYDDLYTEMKHNDEMYAVTTPDPDNAEWIRQSRKHIFNVHLVGNLKPFRWASPSFVQETAKAQQQMGAQGVEVYPLWVWDWPNSADTTPLLQIDRDWLWYAVWARYAWNADRPAEQEQKYWSERIGEKFGDHAAPDILAAYDAAGKVMPSVPRLFWFDGWNHWFAADGLTLDQILSGTPIPFTNVKKTLSVQHYAEALAQGRPIDPEVLTPIALTDDMVQQARSAVEACHKAGPLVEKNQEEFARLQTDIEATLSIAQFYQAKIDAAIHFVRYQTSQKAEDRDMTLQLLGKSVQYYRDLVAKADAAYVTPNDIRNDIPFPFHPPNGMSPMQPTSIPRRPHWRDFLVVYEKEYEIYSSVMK